MEYEIPSVAELADLVDDPIDELARETEKAELRLRAQRAARKRIASEAFEPFAFPDNFEIEAEEPDPEVMWTVDGLHTVGGNTIIIAGFKTGKTTMMHNLIRSLVDGAPFLGQHAIRRIEGRVLYLNFEVEGWLARRDLRRLGFANPSKFTHWPLRGRHFDITDDGVAEWFVAELKRLEIEVLISDPFSGGYFGEENSNTEQTVFTKRVDEIKYQAGVKDFFMPVHTGSAPVEHGAERARGATKLDDWADHRWILTRDADTQVRYFRAEGRGGMNFGSERALTFDLATNELQYNVAIKGTRKTATKDRIRLDVAAYVKANPGKSRNEVQSAITGDDKVIAAALKELTANGEIRIEEGKNRAHLHYPAIRAVGLEDL